MGAWQRLPLSLRVPLLAAALMVLVGVAASQQVLATLERAQQARLRELAVLHVEGLSLALGPSVLRRDVWEIYDTLDRAARESRGGRMVLTAVADEAGRVLAASDPRRAPVDSPVGALTVGARSPGDLAVEGRAPRVRLSAPLIYQGRAVGLIATELDVSDLLAERRRARALLLAGNALATGLLSLGGYLAVRRMMRPIAMLSAHMAETAGAPRPIPADRLPAGDAEPARLARLYNAMAEATLARAEAERRLAERERLVSLGRLASSLAHEINNPLGGLLNATDTIRRYSDRAEVVRRSADLLDRGLRHLRDVARAALDHDRLDRSGAPLAPEDLDDLRLLIEPEAARWGQRLSWSVEAGPEALAGLCAGPLRQIALNLLLNASAAAGPDGAVGLRVAGDAGELRLAVTDDGPGLPEAALARLLTLEPAGGGGGGVGLRLVADLARALGGRIEHRRRDGVTTVAVLLPAHSIAVAAQ